MGSIGAIKGSAGSSTYELEMGTARVQGEQRRGNGEIVRQLRDKYNLELESTDGNDIQNHPARINGDKVTMYKIGTEGEEEYEGTFNYYSDGGKEIVNIRRRRG